MLLINVFSKYVFSLEAGLSSRSTRLNAHSESPSFNSRKALKCDIMLPVSWNNCSPYPKHWQYDTARKLEDMQKTSWESFLKSVTVTNRPETDKTARKYQIQGEHTARKDWRICWTTNCFQRPKAAKHLSFFNAYCLLSPFISLKRKSEAAKKQGMPPLLSLLNRKPLVKLLRK